MANKYRAGEPSTMTPPLVAQAWILRNILADPLSILLLALGALLVAFSLGLFGYLSLRGALAAILPEPGRGTPRQGE